MIYCARTHIGNRRKQNEDSYFIPGRQNPPCLFMVADGMGGLARGKAASRATVETAAMLLGGQEEFCSAGAIVQAVQAANNEVRRMAVHAGVQMGSTLTLTVIDGDQLLVGNVGDSRAYLWNGGMLRCLTRDHSVVEELARSGQITQAEARTHPQRNLITRAIGIRDKVDVDIFECQWQEGSVLLLCSDGLTGQVEDQRLAELLQTGKTLESTAEAMVDQALENGGDDNITLVLVRHTGQEPGRTDP